MSFLSNILGSTSPNYVSASSTPAAVSDARTALARLWSLFPEAPAYASPACAPAAPAAEPSGKPSNGAMHELSPTGRTIVHAEIINGSGNAPPYLRFELQAPDAVHLHGSPLCQRD
jgi:hypothetical protein